jgi:hypothetical protein
MQTNKKILKDKLLLELIEKKLFERSEEDFEKSKRYLEKKGYKLISMELKFDIKTNGQSKKIVNRALSQDT